MATGQGLIQKTAANGQAVTWIVDGEVQTVDTGLTIVQAFDLIKTKAGALPGTVVRIQVTVSSKE